MQFGDLPIKRQLVRGIFLTSLCVLTISCLVLLSYEIYSYKQSTTRNLSTIADIIAANSTAALVFDDPKLAGETLAGLRAEPEVIAAALYDNTGKLYVTYPTNLAVSSVPASPGPNGVNFEVQSVTLSTAVIQGQNRVGTLFLKADLHEMYRRLTLYAVLLGLVLFGSGVLAYLLSNFFERRISKPLLSLARTAKVVSEQKDYSVRGTKINDDELGYLTEAFNSMLDQIQASHSALRESEARLAGVFNQAGAGIAQCDLTGRFMMVNDRYCEITGHTREELLKMGMQNITHPDDLADSQAALGRLIAGVSTSILEKRYVRANGEVIWARTSVAPLRGASGKVESALAVSQDITERKQAEQELERARDVAERANRAKDEFLAALSHELRTPLSPVLLLSSELASDATLPENIRADFATIAKNVALEARLIDDLLDVTRITRGKLPLDQHPTNVHTVLQDALATVHAELKKKSIILELDLAADHRTVMGDEVRLQQVFWNILKNAVKFTPEGGKITIRTSISADGDTLSIVVSDTGIGITPAELVGIFDAFKQGEHAHQGMSHTFGGLGLGLAISRMLVELHSGSLQAFSRGREQGATFTVTLPLLRGATSNAGVDRTPPRANGSQPTPSSSSRPITILLVEDHEPTRTAVAKLLTRRHYEVKLAATAEEARRLFSRENFDLVISDIGLPDGNGYELMQEMRQRNEAVRGIALTGYGMDQDIAKSEASGFAAHLIKPVRVESLESALAAATAQTTPTQNGEV
jgi:PAS domain S-box-containing protein